MHPGQLIILTALILMALPLPALAQEKIVIAGSGDSQHLLRVLARQFERSRPGSVIDIPDSIGSSGGVRATANGDCDLGRVARPLREREKQLRLHYLPIALSPVVLSGNLESACVDNLTAEQINDIYAGRITNWQELGPCPDHKIYVANREEGDSSRSVLEAHVPGFQAVVGTAGQVIFSTPETAQVLASYRYTIAYLPLSVAKSLNLPVFRYAGTAPDAEAVRSGEYPLVNPFALIWKGPLDGLSRQFVEFLFTPEAQQIMIDEGVVPLPRPDSLNEPG